MAVDDGSGRIAEEPMLGEETQLLDFFNKMFGTNSNSSSSSEPGQAGSDAFNLFLQTLMPQIQSDAYSPEAATRDAQGLVDLIFNQYRDTALPQIYQAQNASGGYNSTTGQLLANDAYGRSVAEGAKVTEGVRNNYANIRQKNMNMLMNVVMSMLNASRRTTTAQTNNASNPAAQKAAALGNLAKNAMANRKKQQSNNRINPKTRNSGFSPEDQKFLDDIGANEGRESRDAFDEEAGYVAERMGEAVDDRVVQGDQDIEALGADLAIDLAGNAMEAAGLGEDPFELAGLEERGDGEFGDGSLFDDISDGTDGMSFEFDPEFMDPLPEPEPMDEMEEFEFDFGGDFDLGGEEDE